MRTPTSQQRAPRAGFTLIEVMVALGLFGLIALAGFTLLDGVIGTRDRLDGRLARLAELQRAMYLITLDFEAVDGGPLELSGNALAFRRISPTSPGGSTPVRYLLVNGGLHRQIGASAQQRLIDDVSVVEWNFHFAGRGWASQPNAPVLAGVLQTPEVRADAVALTVDLSGSDGGLGGRLRRVVELPALP